MSSVADKLANSPIERWVKKVEFVSSANLEDIEGSASGVYTFNELVEVTDREQLAKRSKPSYYWQPDAHERWWRIWFKESNLTITIDLHSSGGKYQTNMYEIDLERCSSATSFVEWIYAATLHKQWACPEMLWAVMEVADEISYKRFGESISDAYLAKGELNWAKPN
ncbi:MAG: hypothetical protein RID53_06445 [Coleofasciculus sp. B1-GNL1-01]|uniref:hypothetical protein n=1 Tax=Coleofasciculus sp. B1-GNL1-01 TaxID=3068484 RepID=UPI0032FB0541